MVWAMKTVLFGITWATFQNIVVLPVVIMIFIFLLLKLKRIREAVFLLSQSVRTKFLLKNISPVKQIIKIVLMTVGLVFLFLALLRPQWSKKEQIVAQEGRDLFIAFDVSRSMLVQDCAPNRLECAKQKVKMLLDNFECERVGLILFSGSTCVQCPLTNDYAAFFMFLDQLDVETISSGTTAIDQAIKKALSSFKSMPTRKNKLLILFTDGEDFSSNLAGVRADAVKEGLTIFAIGVGTPDGGPIPNFNEHKKFIGHQKDLKNKIIISRLNEGILDNIAQQTGGHYLRITHDDKDIKSLVCFVEKFEKEKFEDKKVSVLEDRYPYFLVVSFISFALEWLL